MSSTHVRISHTHDYDSIELAGGSSCCGSRCGRSKYLTKATDYVENKFGCLSLFLEMPFKKSPETNDEQNPNQTCLQLGASFLEPVLKLIKI